jgi:hypothetical protein
MSWDLKRGLETAGSFRLRSVDVVWQSFEDETIVIDLASGTYYSLNRSGAAIWNLMQAENTPSDSIRQLLNEAADTPEARNEIIEFWQRLIEERLIEEREAGDGTAPRLASTPPADSFAGPWVAPSITVYRDMEDLFQLDPIHDVNEAGWPSYSAPLES